MLTGSIIPKCDGVVFPPEPALIFRDSCLPVEKIEQSATFLLIHAFNLNRKGDIDVKTLTPCFRVRTDNGMPRIRVFFFHMFQNFFAILGLQPGRYQVMVPHDPGGAQVVELDEEDVYVELVRAGGSGLQLTLDEDDRIVVAEADDEGWLEPGDRLETVTVAGIDVLELAPRYGQEVGELVVGLVGYPGITVVVERDGQPVVVGGE